MGLAVWRDISLLWLIFWSLIAILPVAVLLFFAIRGMHRLRQLAITYLALAQEKAALLAATTEEISLKIAAPIIRARAKTAQVNGMRSAILRRQKP